MSGRLVRVVLTGLLIVVGLAGIVPASAMARSQAEDLSGCGDIFSVASIGIEGRVQGLANSASTVIVSLRIVNVSDDEVTVPVGDDFGVWEVADESGDRTGYEAERSFQLTSDGMGGDLGIAPDGQRTLKLVFKTGGADPAILFNDELGGDLAREGVPLCSGYGEDGDPDHAADDATATPEVARARRTTPTAAATERVAPTATERPDPPTATPSPRRPTATPARATATAGLTQPPRNTPTPRRNTPTPVSRGSSAGAIADDLENSNWQFGEYFGDVPFATSSDCDDLADALCVLAANDVGSVLFIVFDSSAECQQYVRANDLDNSLFTTDHLGYDFYLVPSYLTDDGSSLAIAPVGQVLVVALAEDPGFTSTLYADPDVNAVGLVMGGIQRADRLQ